jgi:BirA family transcriptional regulator, biotin operon repressor / biotin---[acetyl-CoA-carboxylase] ligase
MNDKIISLLKKDEFVSGEFIAEKLGISRTAVWKQIKLLKDKGYEIKSIKNKGYQMKSRPDIPYPEEVLNKLNTRIIGKSILYFEKIDSTNIYAKKLAKEGVFEGCVVVADKQEKGRGRKNRTWISPEGGLWFSIIVYPGVPPQNAMIITMAASVSVVEAVIKKTGLKPAIKWPNDVLINGKKLCGILTEMDAEMDRINYAVIGIGINVNNSISKDLNDLATSLKNQTKKNCSRVELLADILNSFDKNYMYIKSGDSKAVRDSWFMHADIIGKKVEVTLEKDKIVGFVNDIDENGCLILKNDIGIQKIIAGDIKFL